MTGRAFRGHWIGKKTQNTPKYAEMCQRFLADEKDFSKERLAACGIDRGYENNDFNTCIQLILKDIVGNCETH